MVSPVPGQAPRGGVPGRAPRSHAWDGASAARQTVASVSHMLAPSRGVSSPCGGAVLTPDGGWPGAATPQRQPLPKRRCRLLSETRAGVPARQHRLSLVTPRRILALVRQPGLLGVLRRSASAGLRRRSPFFGGRWCSGARHVFAPRGHISMEAVAAHVEVGDRLPGRIEL